MKTWVTLFALALISSTRLLSQPVAAYPAQTPGQIDELISPIALYPDPLVSVILPASTVWPDVQAADHLLRRNVHPATIDAQPWDESVKALAQYPEVVAWMVDNLVWTQSLGATFIEQPAEVMNAIQRLRASARAAGILVDTPQQRVVVQGSYISILPAQAEIVYVPIYDPEIIYVPTGRPLRRGTVTFSVGFRIGTRSHYVSDWNRRTIWIDRSRHGFARAPATTAAEREQWRPRREVIDRVRTARPPASVQIVRPRAFSPTPVAEARAPAAVQPREEQLTPTGRIPAEAPREVIDGAREKREKVPPLPAPKRAEPRSIPPRAEGREVHREKVDTVPPAVPAAPAQPVPVPPVAVPPLPALPTQRDNRPPGRPASPEPRSVERRPENPPKGKAKGQTAPPVEQSQPQPPAKGKNKDEERDR